MIGGKLLAPHPLAYTERDSAAGRKRVIRKIRYSRQYIRREGKVGRRRRTNAAATEEIKLITTPNWIPINMHGRGWKKNGARPRRRCGRDTNKFLRNRSTIYANDDDSGVCASVHSTPSHQHVSFVHRISATVINWVHVVHIRIPRPVLYHRNHNAHWTIIVVVVIRGRCEQNERMPPSTDEMKCRQ